MLDQLGVSADKRNFAALDDQLMPGTPLPKPAGVFPRHQEDESAA